MNEAEESSGAPISQWLAMPMEPSARLALDRIRWAEDVAHIAVMPDVHLAGDVCVGTVMATRRLIYPSAVGGDIGCGMLAIGFNASADLLNNAARAGAILRLLGQAIPAQRRNRSRTLPFPADLSPGDLSQPSLQAIAKNEGQLQFGTLGGGNHFVELQADESDQLWLMINSGSRAMGQEIKGCHLAHAAIHSSSMRALDADTAAGQAYLNDLTWARRFAQANRQAMARQLIELLHSHFKIEPIESSMIACDHNHVCREEHFGQSLLVHRKGAMPAAAELPGVVPGSMGTLSYHVAGRGCPESLLSSAHGAGRLYSRTAARQRFTRASLRQQMHGVWFDPRLVDSLREESPGSYKDVQSVMRAQRDLIRITRTLRPLLVYKGR